MQYSESYNWETGENENNLIDGDTDFCPDTYFYDPLNNFTIFKTEKAEGKRYTSFNIMEGNSRKNSITVDQARRMRMVTDRCPSRWSYKSQYFLDTLFFYRLSDFISFNKTTLYSPQWLPDIFLPDHKKWHNYLPYVRVQALLFPEILFYH